MPEFLSPRSRDAFGAIRGFVYQINLTVQRWLALNDPAQLELERGEDIDTVIRALDGDDEASRLLEQVKYRGKSITLRTDEAIEAIANAVNHFHFNPDSVIGFQFTTNAQSGREKLSPMPGGKSAIDGWEAIRLGQLPVDEIEPHLVGIRTLLASRTKPSKYPADYWERYRRLVESPDVADLRALVGRFSWSTRSPEPKALRQEIVQQLIDLKGSDRALAEQQYKSLFMALVDLLAAPGRKTLSALTLADQLARAPTENANQQRIAAMFSRIDDLDDRVTTLEVRTTADRAAIESRIDSLAAQQGVTASVTRAVVSLVPAPALAISVQRITALDTIVPSVAAGTLVELIGEVGLGKTELARQLAERCGGIRYWVDLRGHDSDSSALQLDSILQSVCPASAADTDRTNAFHAFLSASGTGTVVVLDDVPPRIAGDPLSRRILELRDAAERVGVSVVLTANVRSPTWIVERLDASKYLLHPVAAFGQEEISGVLTAAAAPTKKIESLARLLQIVTSGHPTLLAAAMRYLKARDWVAAENEFDELITGQFAIDIHGDVVRRLTQLVGDAQTRELLYRLNISILALSEEEIAQLASVPEPISRPGERLVDLVDICIQRAPRGLLRPSPLFKQTGMTNLPADTVIRCHVAIGNAIMRRKSVSIDDAVGAISHYINGEDFTRAGLVYIRGVMSLTRAHRKADVGLFGALWATTPLSERMPLSLRLMARAQQIVLFSDQGKPIDYALNDLESLVKQAGPSDSWSVVAAGITVQLTIASFDVLRANRLLTTSLILMEQPSNASPLSFTDQQSQPEELFWINAARSKSVEHLADWIRSVDSLSQDQRVKLFASSLADGGSLHLADAVWMTESEKPEPTRDWTRVLSALKELEAAAERWNCPLLASCAIRSSLIVVTDYLGDIETALKRAEDALQNPDFNGSTAFPIRECMGRQLSYKGRNGLAKLWLELALTDASDHWRQQKIITYHHLASLVELQEAVQYLESARDLFDSHTGEIVSAKVECDLGLAYWLIGDKRRSLLALDRSLDLIIEHRDEAEPVWRAAAVVIGHYISYVATIQTTGTPPTEAADGGEYAPPTLGMLAKIGLKPGEWDSYKRLSYLMGMLASMADTLGEDDIVARRSVQALDAASSENHLLMIASVGFDHALNLVAQDRYPDAVALAIQAGAAARALDLVRKSGGNVYATDRRVEEILGPKPSPDWSNAEYSAVLFVIVPLMFRLAKRSIDDPEDGKRGAAEVIEAFKLAASTASDAEMWTKMAEVFELTFTKPADGGSLLSLGNPMKSRGPSAQAVAYIGASIVGSLDLVQVGWIHLELFSSPHLVHPNSKIYDRLALPFLESFWDMIFREQAFRFTPPALFRRRFDEARSLPVNRRAQAVLTVAVEALGRRANDKHAEWLRSQL